MRTSEAFAESNLEPGFGGICRVGRKGKAKFFALV